MTLQEEKIQGIKNQSHQRKFRKMTMPKGYRKKSSGNERITVVEVTGKIFSASQNCLIKQSYLLAAKKLFMSMAHSSSKTPPIKFVLGWKGLLSPATFL